MDESGVATRFRNVLKRKGWLDVKSPVLLAVSGGSDSMSLLRLFSQTLEADKIAVVHMDHGLRDTAFRDRNFVAARCASLGVPCVIERRPVLELRRPGESEESAGRRLRYELYAKVREELGCGYVALGHTRNDLAENALMNLARGCGLWGLGGMPEQRGCYIRPLLGFRRNELRRFLLDEGWSWIEDESNDSDRYQRNRVRHEVIPLIEERVNRGIAGHLADLAEEAQAWRDEEDAEARELWNMACVPSDRWPCLDLKKLRKLRPFQRSRLLRYCGRRLDLGSLSRSRTEELCGLIVRSGRWVFQWGSAVDLRAQEGLLRFHPASEKYSTGMELRLGESARWGGWHVSLARRPEGEKGPDYGFSCRMDEERPVVLSRNDDNGSGNDPAFPIIFQKDAFLAQKLPGGWEICHHSVKYNVVCQVVLNPLVGSWREEAWNLERRKS